jgi:ferrous iron transport protein B
MIPATSPKGPAFRVALVGNPNCGKTSVFNRLTGAHQRVGNWPGVTVERKEGHFSHAGAVVTVVDLPGVYSLTVTGSSALDERIARDFILAREADVVVNIVDASNLERNLYLTIQLLEMQVPTIVVLNMMDAAKAQGLAIDLEGLASRLGVPVHGVVATTGQGFDAFKSGMVAAAAARPRSSLAIPYAEPVETAVARLARILPKDTAETGVTARWSALKLLEGDAAVYAAASADARQAVDDARAAVAGSRGEDVDILIADARFGCAHDLKERHARRQGAATRSITDRIDAVVLNRVLGIPIFLAVMYAMFLFSINVGNAFIDFFDILAGTLLVDGLGHALTAIGLPDLVRTIVADGAGGGLQTVATFIPVIGCLFLFLSVLEDSGYMARAAFVMDRFMKWLGLPGKSFVPMMVGFGCTVPAVMATRTLDNHRDRVLTAVMAHFMSCGARLPVYALFAAAFFPVGGQNVVFALYLIGIAFAAMTGVLLKSTVLAGQSSPFLIELPLYHMPTVQGVLFRTWDRLKSFLSKAGKFIVAVAVVLTFLNSLGRDGSFGNQDTQNSVLAAIGESLIPVFRPMGIEADNWPAAVGLFTGLFAKEVVVGTLDALYSQFDSEPAAAAAETGFDLAAGVGAAFASIPANLATLGDRLLDPLGLDVTQSADLADAAETQAVSLSTFGAMAERFDGAVGAFAYLIAILLYSPCMSALSAYYRELSAAWTAFVAIYSTLLAYGFAVLTYQVGTFARDPATATAWIVAILAALATGAAWLYLSGHRTRRGALQPAE